MKRTRTSAVIAGLGAAPQFFCQGAPQSSSTGSLAPGPLNLKLLGLGPQHAEVVDVWNKQNPTIQVKYNGGRRCERPAPKLLSAERAGNGPDVAQVEYQKLLARRGWCRQGHHQRSEELQGGVHGLHLGLDDASTGLSTASRRTSDR